MTTGCAIFSNEQPTCRPANARSFLRPDAETTRPSSRNFAIYLSQMLLRWQTSPGNVRRFGTT